MQDLNDQIKKQALTKQIRGTGIIVSKKKERKTSCVSCIKRFNEKGN